MKKNKYRDFRMDPELRRIRKEMIKNMDSLLDSIADAILEGNIFVFTTENIIEEELIKKNNLKIEHVLEEQLRFTHGKEPATLAILQKNEDFIRFVNNVCDKDINLDKLAGVSILKDKITDIIEIADFQISAEAEFNKENIKNVMYKILPTVDELIAMLDKEVIEEFAENVIIDGIFSITSKDESDRKINQEKGNRVRKESGRRASKSK